LNLASEDLTPGPSPQERGEVTAQISTSNISTLFIEVSAHQKPFSIRMRLKIQKIIERNLLFLNKD
jgi:hypothetical protein